jgi:NADH:ubiquinone oxidoreductase subunit 2 (subunit N)
MSKALVSIIVTLTASMQLFRKIWEKMQVNDLLSPFATGFFICFVQISENNLVSMYLGLNLTSCGNKWSFFLEFTIADCVAPA